MVVNGNPGPNKTHVCIICLKRFATEPLRHSAAANVVQVKTEPETENNTPPDLNQNDPPHNSHLTSNAQENEQLPQPSSSSPDNYIRFLRFVERHFKLRTHAGVLMAYEKKLKEENGPDWKFQVFCKSCDKLVSSVCDIYAEIRERHLRLLGILSCMGDVMKGATKKVSLKLEFGLLKAVAKYLNLSSNKVFQFRKAVQIKCIHQRKKCAPRVVVHRGLVPKEWKFTYAATKKALIQLIVIFGLAITTNKPKDEPEPDCKPITENTDVVPKRRRGRPCRKSVPIFDSNPGDEIKNDDQITVKKEKETREADHLEKTDALAMEADWNEDGPPSPDQGADSDPDWQDGATSPVSNVSSDADVKDNPDSDPDFEEKPRIRTRRRGRPPGPNAKNQKKVPDKPVENPMKCPQCPNKEFRGYRGLRKHMIAIHNVLTIPYPCKICGETKSNNQEMRDHVLTAHHSREILKCPKCPDRSFRANVGYRLHMKTMHNEAVKFPCKHCG